ncbi:SDR family oxidoreductase [Brevibacterium salitolerans]|uniref:3-oxoacyl-ACP reductase FabG n=1 Tax=Brevibacterium salitolerans TaxID=1403566 RepID=A0ABN2X2E0_9MICO
MTAADAGGRAAGSAAYAHSLVLVTGGARGIGRHLAEGFVRAGYPVLLTARGEESAQRAAGEIAAAAGAGASAPVLSPRVRGTALDQTDPASVAALAETVEALGREWDAPLCVLVNNAGIVEKAEGPVWEIDAEDMAAVLETNLVGAFRVTRALLPGLLATAESSGAPVRIIDLNSGSGAQGTSAHAAYSASKAGLFRLAQSLVDYGHERGLRVFEMAPGVIESDMTKSMPMHDHRTAADWTDPADVVELALTLASGELDAWTGRFVRAGRDTPAALREAASGLIPGDLSDGTRVLTVPM